MIEDEDRAAGPGARPEDGPPPAANDNGDSQVRIDAAVLTIARLIGRQMAQEKFARLIAANDNRPQGRYDD